MLVKILETYLGIAIFLMWKVDTQNYAASIHSSFSVRNELVQFSNCNIWQIMYHKTFSAVPWHCLSFGLLNFFHGHSVTHKYNKHEV